MGAVTRTEPRRSATQVSTRPERAPSKRVAVTVPLASYPELSPDEEISLRHLRHYLGAYDRFVLAPESMDVPHDDFEIIRFPDRYFGSANAHTRFIMTPGYYETFRDYEFILTYQLDALVLSDELLDWCDAGLDFVSAPNYGLADHFSMPCSGGFALRRVESFLKVFYSDRFAVDPDEYWRRLSAGKPLASRLLNLPRKYLKRMRRFNNVQRDIDLFLQETNGPLLEDEFFVLKGPRYNPDFKLPSIETALRFAFDEHPRAAFDLAGGRLPFGAHAWFKQDREFWAPYLLDA